MSIALSLLALALANAGPVTEAKTPAAVIVKDDAWLQAEVHGDGDFLDHLLVDGYRSVEDSGKVTDKTALVSKARARGDSPDMAAKVAAWKAAHPTRPDVLIKGDTAILTWFSTKPDSGEPVSSCDIFIYDAGHWRAVYSQHTAAAV